MKTSWTHVFVASVIADCLAGATAAGPARPTLQLCQDGVALGEARLAYPDTGFLPKLTSLAQDLPLLHRAVKKLGPVSCVPMAPVLEGLLDLAVPPDVPIDPVILEEQHLRSWLDAWQQKEAIASGLGALLLLGRPEQWQRIAPGDPQGLSQAIRTLAARARTTGRDAEVLALPCLVTPADETLRDLAARAASAFADGFARSREKLLSDLAQQTRALDQEILLRGMKLGQASGEIAGAVEELTRLADLGRSLVRERRPAEEGARLEALLTERRTATGKRLLDALAQAVRLAGERRDQQRALAEARARQQALAKSAGRVVIFPKDPFPMQYEPRAVALLAIGPDADPVKEGLALVIVQRAEGGAAMRPATRPKPFRRPGRKLEEYGVEATGGETPAGGKAPPVDSAAATRESNIQACALGNSAACYQAGLALEAGSGGPRDLFEARRHFQKGCDGGFDLACYQLATYLMSGQGGAQEQTAGQKLLQRTCKNGIKQACKALESR